MSIARAVLSFFGLNDPYEHREMHEGLKAGYSKRTLTLVGAPDHAPVAAEVDSERQRYSARRFIEHMKACENGDRRGAKEWSRYILTMRHQRPDDYASFYGEVDELIAKGELWNVLTPEEEAERVRNVLAKKDQIMADSLRPMHGSDPVAFEDVPEEMQARAGREIASRGGAVWGGAAIGLPEWPDISSEDYDDGEDEEGGAARGGDSSSGGDGGSAEAGEDASGDGELRAVHEADGGDDPRCYDRGGREG